MCIECLSMLMGAAATSSRFHATTDSPRLALSKGWGACSVQMAVHG